MALPARIRATSDVGLSQLDSTAPARAPRPCVSRDPGGASERVDRPTAFGAKLSSRRIRQCPASAHPATATADESFARREEGHSARGAAWFGRRRRPFPGSVFTCAAYSLPDILATAASIPAPAFSIGST
jgi:hypothetical protein